MGETRVMPRQKIRHLRRSLRQVKILHSEHVPHRIQYRAFV